MFSCSISSRRHHLWSCRTLFIISRSRRARTRRGGGGFLRVIVMATTSSWCHSHFLGLLSVCHLLILDFHTHLPTCSPSADYSTSVQMVWVSSLFLEYFPSCFFLFSLSWLPADEPCFCSTLLPATGFFKNTETGLWMEIIQKKQIKAGKL